MDSDIKFHRHGILESMKNKLPTEFICCGEIEMIDDSGINTNKQNTIQYIHPSCMYLNINEYLKLSPAKLPGSPFIDTFKSVQEKGKSNFLIDFDVNKYMNHLGRGTVIRTGGYHTRNHPKYSGNKETKI